MWHLEQKQDIINDVDKEKQQPQYLCSHQNCNESFAIKGFDVCLVKSHQLHIEHTSKTSDGECTRNGHISIY